MKKFILVAVCISCFLWGSELVFAANAPADLEKKRQDSLRAVRLEKVTAFRAVYPNVQIQTNPVTGVPEDLWGDLSKKQAQNDPVEAIYEFFQQNKDLYGITDPRAELKVTGVSKGGATSDPFGPLVVLRQVYKGVDVYKSMIKVNFSRRGKLLGVSGSFAQIPDLFTSPSIDSLSATRIVKRDLDYTEEQEKKMAEFQKVAGSNRLPVNANLVVAPFENQFRLVWMVDASRIQPSGSWAYWVDAHSGAILSKGSALLDEEPFVPIPAPRRTPPEGRKNDFLGPIEPKSILTEEKQGPVLPLDTSLPPREIPTPADSGKAQPPSVPKRPETFQFEQKMQIRRDTLKSGKIIPAHFRLNLPIDSIIKWQPRMMDSEKNAQSTNSAKTPSPESPQGAGKTAFFQTIVAENFEGQFPVLGSNWYVFDNDSTVNGEYYWDDDNFKAANGSWSAWCARGGLNGLNPRFNLYPNNMNSWMLYGPFSLSNASSAYLSFNFWCRAEPGYDTLGWAVSVDGMDFYGPPAFSDTATYWQGGYLDLTNAPGLGNLTGRSGLWFAFIFKSDGLYSDSGAYIDDIALWKDAPLGTSQLTCGQGSGWSGPIVVSNQRGTSTHSPVIVGDTAFIDWGVANLSIDIPTAVAFTTSLFIDNMSIPIQSWRVDPPVNPVSVRPLYDFPYVFTTPGQHTIRVVHDVYNTVEESPYENDNSCELQVNVGGCSAGDYIGWGYGALDEIQNHIDTRCDGTRFWLTDFTRQSNNDPHGHHGQMTSSINTYREESGVYHLMEDPDNIWDSVGQASGVDAHVYAGLTYDYLNNILNRNGFDGVGGPMLSITEVFRSGILGRASYEPANNWVLYTQSSPDYNPSYSGSIEIVAHEWAHGVTDTTSKLTNVKESGALGESFGDMLGAAVSYANGDPDYWIIGEDIPQLQTKRNMSDPLASGQPDTYRGANWFTTTSCTPPDSDNCGIHRNSGVPNKMFYLLSEGGVHNGITVTSIGIDYAMNIMYLANARRWGPSTNFLQARIGSIQIADSLFPFWGQQLRNAWDAVNVCDKGDVNGDGTESPADIVEMLLCIFTDPSYCNPCEGDMNCDRSFSPSDAVIALNVIFGGGHNGKPDGCPIDP